MQWEFIAVLILAVPIVLLPVAYIWYLNVGGLYEAVRSALSRRAARNRTRIERYSSGGPAFQADPRSAAEKDDLRDGES